MRTPLYPYHVQHAKITAFAGYEMPLVYTSALKEALAVREKAGLFDVSHMGPIEVQGVKAEEFLDYAATNIIAGKDEGTATYTTLADNDGGCIDDVMVMRVTKTRFIVVSNAANKEKVHTHFIKEAKAFEGTSIFPLYQKAGFLALQGKGAESLIMPEAAGLQKHSLLTFIHPRFGELLISRTGYTGEDGFEILVKNELMLPLWEEILANANIAPCGLAARDILRMEMGYALYGHELSAEISPIESVSHWTVKLNKEGNFIGKEALLKKSTEKHRVQQGIILEGKGVIREGFSVKKGDAIVGKITSGGFSPTLNNSIGIALLDEKLALGQEVFIDIRGRQEPARIVKMPFIPGM